MFKDLDFDALLPYFIATLIASIVAGVLAAAFYNGSTSRTCRENLAKLEPSRTAADIHFICK